MLRANVLLRRIGYGTLWAIGLLGTGSVTHAIAQTSQYFIQLTDKQNSPYSTQQPETFLSERAIERRTRQQILVTKRDLPVNSSYLQEISRKGANVLHASKWLNAVLVEADGVSFAALQQLPFVKQIHSWETNQSQQQAKVNVSGSQPEIFNQPLQNKQVSRVSDLDYGAAIDQITMLEADRMHQAGYTGKGICIAVFDSGFENADQIASLQPAFTAARVLATYDFVDRETSVYEDDAHGLEVLSTIAAYQPGELIGTGYEADLLLLRTENVFSETRAEEMNWLMAAEFADSAGADIISSSLNYNTFDQSAQNYRPSQMDGNTALITQAADAAAAVGILVVNSASNEGNSSWQIISAPADGDSVLAVGAVDRSGAYASFSSRGPSADGRVKPDVAAMGQGTTINLSSGNVSINNGTSFSAPLVAGLAAGIWQAYPGLTNMQLLDFLRQSASQYENPDPLLGYGIPGFTRAAQLINASPTGLDDPTGAGKSLLLYPNPVTQNRLTIRVAAGLQGKNINLRFFDVTGRLITEQKIASAAENNVLTLAPVIFPTGLYLLQVVTSNSQHTIKFVIQ